MNARSLRPWLAMTIAVSVAGVLAPAARADTTNAVLSRTTSASEQFTAYASSPLFSSAICVFAERVKRAWLAELNMPDNWRDPIIVVLRERDSSTAGMPPISVDAFQNEIHLKYQITCVMPPPLDGRLMAVAVVETLCDEFANREQPTSRTTGYIRAPIPPWLVQGLAESLEGRADSLLEVARRSVSAGRPQTASELIKTMTLAVRSCRAGTLSRQRVDADGGIVFASERHGEDAAFPDGAWCDQIRQQCLLGRVWDRLSPGGDAGEMVEHPTGAMHRDGRRPKPVA